MEITYLKTAEELELLKQKYPVLVLDFYSDECPPCEKLAPIYEKMAKIFSEIKFVKVFRQENRELALSMGVSGSPTVLFFKEGELLDIRLSGEIEEKNLKTILDSINVSNVAISPTEEKKNIEEHDLCIIGNGPAGLSAALYGARYKINQLLIGDLPGGLMTSSHKICNFPSEIEISGMELTKKMTDQIESLNVPQKKFTRVENIEQFDRYYKLTLSNGEKIKTKTILLATGTKHNHLNLPNEESFVGKGVSYCATCDAFFYADKTVAVIGGSDSANTASLYLADIAKKVYQIYRGNSLRGDVSWIDQVKANDKIEVIYNTNVIEIIGDKQVSGLRLDKEFNGKTDLEVDGMFVEIGSKPEPTLINQLNLKVDDNGYVVTKADQMTSRDGVWAAGDITTGSDNFRQIITACSEGSIAAQSIYKYIQVNK